MPINQTSSNHLNAGHTHAGVNAGELMPETVETKLLERAKNILRDPLTFILLVWALMFAVAGVCWILSL